VNFARETVAEVSDDILPLIALHAQEIEGRESSVDFERFAQFERVGILRIYTARLDRALKGYVLYLLGPSLNFKHVQMAQQTGIYVHPDARGPTSARFLRFTEGELATEGIRLVSQTSNARRPIDNWLKRLGYALAETSYVKVL
jgi:hypothetical protein